MAPTRVFQAVKTKIQSGLKDTEQARAFLAALPSAVARYTYVTWQVHLLLLLWVLDCLANGEEVPLINQKTIRCAIYTVTHGGRWDRTAASNPFARVLEAFWTELEQRETHAPEHPVLGGGMRAGQMARIDRRPLWPSLDEWTVTYHALMLNHVKYNMHKRISDLFKCKLERIFHVEPETKKLARSTVNNAATILADAIETYDPATKGVHPDDMRAAFASACLVLPAKLRACVHPSKPGRPEKLTQLEAEFCGLLSQMCHPQPQEVGPPDFLLPLLPGAPGLTD